MNELAIAYCSAGDAVRAIPLFEETLKVMRAKFGPEYPDTLSVMNNLAGAYRSAGDVAKAISLLEETLKLQKVKIGRAHPDTLQSTRNLAWILATCRDDRFRDGRRAVELAHEASEAVVYKDASIVRTLAAAYAETGEWEEAIKCSKKALELADISLKDQLQKELASYEAKQPWRNR
jgi:tetratricopeptide (TPR) repeat protein